MRAGMLLCGAPRARGEGAAAVRGRGHPGVCVTSAAGATPRARLTRAFPSADLDSPVVKLALRLTSALLYGVALVHNVRPPPSACMPINHSLAACALAPHRRVPCYAAQGEVCVRRGDALPILSPASVAVCGRCRAAATCCASRAITCAPLAATTGWRYLRLSTWPRRPSAHRARTPR